MDKIFEYLGYKPEEGKEGDLDAFQEHFNARFIARDKAPTDPELVKKFEGSRIGSINTAAKRLFGEVLGMEADDFKNTKLEDVLDKLKGHYDNEITTLKEKSKEGADKRIHDLTAQIEEKDKSLQNFKDRIKKTEQEFEGFKQKKQGEIETYMVNHQLGEVYGKLPFKDAMTEIEKQGFRALVGGQYKFGLNEENKLIVKDLEGNGIASKKTASENASPLEVLSMLAEKNELLKKNNAKPTNGIRTEPPKGTEPKTISSSAQNMRKIMGM